MTGRVRRRAGRERIGDEMSLEARSAMVRCQGITREQGRLLRDPSSSAATLLRTLAQEKGDLLAISHADWLRRCRP